MSSKHRDTFQERILNGLIGAGSDSFGLPDEEEILSDYPLQRYFSAVIFPEKKFSATENEEEEIELQTETEEVNNLTPEEVVAEAKNDETAEPKKEEGAEDENKANQNHFHPNNFGLTFCIDPNVETIEVEFSGGFYYTPEKQSEIKIKIAEAGYQAFNDEKLGFPFKDILVYENGYLSLSRELKGDKGGKNQRSGEYLQFDDFKKTDSYKDSSAKYYIEYFQKLIGRIWKRKTFSHTATIKVEDTAQPIDIPIADKSHKEAKLGYNVKTYSVKGNKYVKIQLVNTSKEQSSKRFTPKTPELNSKCLFQAEIKVKSGKILPYKSNQELNPFDPEAEELNFLYREVKNYGIGHNCSVTWNNEGNTLQTTFLPEFNVKDTKNDFNENDFENPDDFKLLNQSLDIKNLSLFSDVDKGETIGRLQNFVELYGKWIEEQKVINEAGTAKEREIGQRIIDRLDYNYNRLKANID